LVWFGLVWFGLVWFGYPNEHFEPGRAHVSAACLEVQKHFHDLRSSICHGRKLLQSGKRALLEAARGSKRPPITCHPIRSCEAVADWLAFTPTTTTAWPLDLENCN